MKNYIGISRDHSGSMSMIANAAARDYNDNIASIKEEAGSFNIDTIVSVIKCGTGRPAQNRWDVQNSNVTALKPLTSYIADGNCTPLFDSVMMLIDQMESVPDAADPEVSFMVMVVTDGQDNASNTKGPQLAQRIKSLQATDRWTFVFRVPKGDKAPLVRMGLPAGNILEWEQTERGVQQATVATKSAMRGFYAARSTGATSTDKFYADMSTTTLNEVKAALVDISKEVDVYVVDTKNDGV